MTLLFSEPLKVNLRLTFFSHGSHLRHVPSHFSTTALSYCIYCNVDMSSHSKLFHHDALVLGSRRYPPDNFYYKLTRNAKTSLRAVITLV